MANNIKKIFSSVLLALCLSSEVVSTQDIDKGAQKIAAEQLKATFNQTTFTNFEPAPIDGWYQAEISNQVVYFSHKQELMFFGEVYTKNGVSLSEQTRIKWQSKRTDNLDVSTALSIGNGLIEIIEFTDTDCPFCLRFNKWITTKNNAYKSKYGKDLFTRKLVLTPIDQLHPNAHKESVHIICQNPDKWEVTITKTLESKISYADMDSCQKGKDTLVQHRKITKEFGVSATPTLIIAGQVIQGFNQQKLEAIVKQQLTKLENK
ncbi:disulfide isomerase DsbC N-terminal domain-containing protein [Bathymodiolus thermophilus thioautotrophic gill symbiont]|uniref:Thiol:disulfide interchange protein DsbC n=1 Tax=Bathymodiolus thermophilus thioautotrophic gill symbiont TaxID=2360 RepID=A0A1J5TXQ2_9GAMM|nr:disulfide isomerase DsbC N-terminal domain-containing protein [Bathymodiolus thermophilus thioautotrophic gill symbiont]OIR25627.1 hypothetical protein BGC33_13710 [Bathymodiolus thermophilus thioautotrophic gill symbiont]